MLGQSSHTPLRYHSIDYILSYVLLTFQADVATLTHAFVFTLAFHTRGLAIFIRMWKNFHVFSDEHFVFLFPAFRNKHSVFPPQTLFFYFFLIPLYLETRSRVKSLHYRYKWSLRLNFFLIEVVPSR